MFLPCESNSSQALTDRRACGASAQVHCTPPSSDFRWPRRNALDMAGHDIWLLVNHHIKHGQRPRARFNAVRLPMYVHPGHCWPMAQYPRSHVRDKEYGHCNDATINNPRNAHISRDTRTPSPPVGTTTGSSTVSGCPPCSSCHYSTSAGWKRVVLDCPSAPQDRLDRPPRQTTWDRAARR